MSNVLLIDFGSTYTKATAVDLDKEVIVGTARGITTVETDVMEGLNQALDQLFAKTGKLTFNKVLGCSSAAGGLKMVAVGLVPGLTAEAAKRAALGAGAKVLGVYGGELSEYEVAEIASLKPDIILLAGGTDGGNKAVILHNANMLNTLQDNIPIVVAGNKSVAPAVVNILSAAKTDVIHTENVMPQINQLNIEPARQSIRQIFLKRIVEAKGIHRANRFVDRMVMPTPAAVLKAADILSRGTSVTPGLGDLMVVDIGGATTDLYSIAKGDPSKSNVALRGLPEPFAKRTVEGDLGMRYSAAALLKAAGVQMLASFAKVSEQDIIDYVDKVEADIKYLPQTEDELKIEIAMGKACTAVAADRHAGQVENVFTIQGTAFVQNGKDLTGVKTVIGTGGVIVNNQRPAEILQGIVYTETNPHILKPLKPEYLIDHQYIMAAMGLLGEEYPDIAIRMLKRYIQKG